MKLSERIENHDFESVEDVSAPAYDAMEVETMLAIWADKVRELESTLPDTQAAIDAALESVVQFLVDTSDEEPHNDYERGQNFQIDLTLEHIRSRIGINPLAQAQVRIMELEANLEAAIDAALESVAQMCDERAFGVGGAAAKCAADIRSRIGTNPLAERDARIVELEAKLEVSAKMSDVDTAFYNLVVKERNIAWDSITQLKAKLEAMGEPHAL